MKRCGFIDEIDHLERLDGFHLQDRYMDDDYIDRIEKVKHRAYRREWGKYAKYISYDDYDESCNGSYHSRNSGGGAYVY